MARLHIRWHIRRDMEEVMAIDAASFPVAWTEEEFLYNLRQRNCIGMVAECGEIIVGFMVYALHEKRLQLLRLAVHQGHRMSGVGSALVDKLVGKLSSHRRTRIATDVSDRNLGACLFLKSQGFRAIDVIRGEDEDAIAFEYRLRQRREVSHETP